MKKMKKALAATLVATMVMGTTSMVALADTTAVKSTETIFKFVKNYVTSDGEVPDVYPAEVLKFIVAPDSSNPDTNNITIADHTVDGNPDNVTITIPEYTKVGKYNYTVKEEEGKTQGVTYAENEFGIQVLVTYNEDQTALDTQIVFTTKDGETVDDEGNPVKIDKFTNIYDLGSLDVTKTVEGNLGSKTKEFDVDVTFKVADGMEMKSDITYVDGTTTKYITVDNMNDGMETVTITVKHGETVKFTNIPDGVTYEILEQSKHTASVDNVNSEEGYTDTYENSDDTTKAEADKTTDKGIGSININEDQSADVDTVAITNTKGTVVDTGISLDNMPYIMMLAMTVLGAFGFVSKKRKEEEMF